MAASLLSSSCFRLSPTRTTRPNFSPSSPSLYLHSLNEAASFAPCSAFHDFKGVSMTQKSNFLMEAVASNSHSLPNAANTAPGQSDESAGLNLKKVIEIAGALLDKLPEPVKSFPWRDVFYNYLDIVIQLFCVVCKYLFVPLLAITSLSELSYSARERKMVLVPIPLLLGWFAAGSINDTILEASTMAQECEVPWHLLGMAIFFTLLKLPGPYYPYWGRIFIPHFANGGVWRTLWFFIWWARTRRQQKNGSETLEGKLET